MERAESYQEAAGRPPGPVRRREFESDTLSLICLLALLAFLLRGCGREKAKEPSVIHPSQEVLQLWVERALEKGPNRVYLEENRTVGYQRARKDFQLEPEVIFLRVDGWSLGACREKAGLAEAMYPDEWVAVIHHRARNGPGGGGGATWKRYRRAEDSQSSKLRFQADRKRSPRH